MNYEKEIDALYDEKYKISIKECKSNAEYKENCRQMNAIDYKISKLREAQRSGWRTK